MLERAISNASFPTEDLRRPLRQIARDTQSSFARVMQTEKQMIRRIRGLLDADPEFDELYVRLRKHPGEESVAISRELESLLASMSASAFLRRLRVADAAEAARMLHDLLTRAKADFERIVHDQMKTLSHDQREELFSPAVGDKPEPAR